MRTLGGMDSLLSRMQPCSSLSLKPTLSSSSLGAQTPPAEVAQGWAGHSASPLPASLLPARTGVPGMTCCGLRKACRLAEKVAPKVLNLSPGDQTLTKATL